MAEKEAFSSTEIVDSVRLDTPPGFDYRNDVKIDEDAKVTNVENTEFAEALAKNPPKTFSLPMIMHFFIICLASMNSCMNGFDGSIMGGVNAMPQFHEYFGFGETGATIGLVFACYSLGNIIGSPFAGPSVDRYGRRFGMFVGCLLICLGTALQATAQNTGMFIAGRLICGIGVSIASSAGPTYVVEIAHPKYRGALTGFYNGGFYYFGAIAATWLMYGTSWIQGNMAWRLPIIIQAAPAVIIIAFVWFIPESPRWLIANGHIEKGRAIFAKYHCNGQLDADLVTLQVREIEASLGEFRSDKRWWDYRELFSSKNARHRTWLVFSIGFLGSFLGGAVISYYMPVILGMAGISDAHQQLLYNAINTVVSCVSAMAGCLFVNNFGRRRMLLIGTTACFIIFLIITILSALFTGNPSDPKALSTAFVAFIILYGVFYSSSWTPMQTLYPVEVLTTQTRGKGMGFYGFTGNLANFINTYSAPVGLQNLGWKFYFVWLIWDIIYIGIIYFTFVETKGRTLEELDEVFSSPNPVKTSISKHKVYVKRGVGVVAAEEE